MKRLGKLTKRELGITLLIAKNLSSEKIGKALNISKYTVLRHRRNICSKLGLKGHNALLHFSMGVLKSEFSRMSFPDGIPVPYQILDERGIFIEVNNALLDTLGYSREELIGKEFFDHIHEADSHSFSLSSPFLSLEKANESNKDVFILTIRRKTGCSCLTSLTKWLEYSHNRERVEIHCIWMDISEGKVKKM